MTVQTVTAPYSKDACQMVKGLSMSGGVADILGLYIGYLWKDQTSFTGMVVATCVCSGFLSLCSTTYALSEIYMRRHHPKSYTFDEPVVYPFSTKAVTTTGIIAATAAGLGLGALLATNIPLDVWHPDLSTRTIINIGMSSLEASAITVFLATQLYLRKHFPLLERNTQVLVEGGVPIVHRDDEALFSA